MTDNLRGHTSKVSSMQSRGNPNSSATIFIPKTKRQKTQKTSPPINPGPSGPSKRNSFDKPIDLTTDDAEPLSLRSAVLDDSDDSLNLGAAERSKPRIANDGRATQRLIAERRGGEPSKVVDTDTETEAIEEFPVPEKKSVKEKGGVVRNLVRGIESRNGRDPPKLALNLNNPLASIPSGKSGLRVRPLFTEEEESLADILIPRRSQITFSSPRSLRKAGGKICLPYL